MVATKWVEWYLDAIANQVSAAEVNFRQSMATFSAVLAGVRHSVRFEMEVRSVQRLVIPVWLAIVGGSVTRRELIRYSQVTEETLSRDLRRLSGWDLLAPRGKGRGAHYVPGAAIEAWGPFEELVEVVLGGGIPAALTYLTDRETPKLF